MFAVALVALPCAGLALGWLADHVFETSGDFTILGGALGFLACLAAVFIASGAGRLSGTVAADSRRASVNDPPNSGAGAADAETGRGGENLRVLVVEPDAELLQTITRYLAQDGSLPWPASSAREAHESIGRYGSPDLILLDLDLPGVNPIDALIGLRCSARRHVPVGFLSRAGGSAIRLGGCPVMGPPFGRIRVSAFIEEVFLVERVASRPHHRTWQ
jgi:CheY-like chemotaxis protein